MSTRRIGTQMMWILSAITQLVMLWAAVRVIIGNDDQQWQNLLGWDTVALLYLGVGVVGVWYQARHTDPSAPASGVERPASRLVGFYWGVLPALFSLLGLTAALDVLFIGNRPDPLSDGGGFTRGLAAVAIVTAWLMLHLSYARLYEYIVSREGDGLEFPGSPKRPTGVEYLYFAITVGASFATSDASITTTACAGACSPTRCSASSTTRSCWRSASAFSPAAELSTWGRAEHRRPIGVHTDRPPVRGELISLSSCRPRRARCRCERWW